MPRRLAQGFTLLEILLVVLIVGIIVTFASLSLGNRTIDDTLETEAERLRQLLALAAEDAEVQGLELGWRYTVDGYGFLVLNDAGEWVPAVGPLRERTLPQLLHIELKVEDRAVPPASEEPAQPQVLLLSSGETTAFRLDLHAQGYDPFIRLQADVLGRVTKRRFEEPQ